MPPASPFRAFFWQLLVVVFVLGSLVAPRVVAASSLPITGWAWSDYTGWISFSGTNAGSGGSYGVSEDSISGALSGYAWSSNLGWISFNMTSGCPSGACAPAVNLSTGKITGWARACSMFASKSLCSGAFDGNSGGWDGWIALSDPAGSKYGVTQNLTTCAWNGFAWGSDAIGAISMNGSTYGVGCVPFVSQSDLTAGPVSPVSATAGTATTFSATVSNIGIGSTVSGFTNLFQRATDSSGTGATDIGTSAMSALAADATATASLSYTFASPGAFYMRVCADKGFAGDTGTIAETNKNNNCGAWTAVVIAPAALPPAVTLSASRVVIDRGNSSTLTWSSTNATSCSAVGGFSTGGATSGSVSVSPSATSNYQVTCTGPGGSANSNIVTVTVVSVTASISAVPTCVSGGGSSKISWSATPVSQVASCNVSGPGLSSTQLTGSQTVNVTSKSTYIVACQTISGSTVTKQAIVDVSGCWSEF